MLHLPLSYYVVGAIFLLLLYVLLAKFYLTDQRRMTSYTQGRIKSVEQRTIVTERERRHETDLVATFTAMGQEIEVKRTLPGQRAVRHPVGSEIPIRYNPGEPWMAEIIKPV
jgi:hypothetical protein